MKAETHKEKVGKEGEVHIPDDYRKALGLDAGNEVEWRLTGKGLLIEPVQEAVAQKETSKSHVDALVGMIPLPQEMIDELVENEDMYGPLEVD